MQDGREYLIHMLVNLKFLGGFPILQVYHQSMMLMDLKVILQLVAEEFLITLILASRALPIQLNEISAVPSLSHHQATL